MLLKTTKNKFPHNSIQQGLDMLKNGTDLAEKFPQFLNLTSAEQEVYRTAIGHLRTAHNLFSRIKANH